MILQFLNDTLFFSLLVCKNKESPFRNQRKNIGILFQKKMSDLLWEKYCLRKKLFKLEVESTDKRTDVWSRNFMIWKINFGLWPWLVSGKKWSGPILSNFFGWFFQFFVGKKNFFLNFFYIVASALKSCIK